jgi:hypothetical protein
VYADQSFLLELGESATDCLQFQAEVGAYLLARHAQIEFRRRIAARSEALRQIKQEHRQAFLGTHAAQQQHYPALADELTAHQLVEIALQVGNFLRELLTVVPICD